MGLEASDSSQLPAVLPSDTASGTGRVAAPSSLPIRFSASKDTVRGGSQVPARQNHKQLICK